MDDVPIDRVVCGVPVDVPRETDGRVSDRDRDGDDDDDDDDDDARRVRFGRDGRRTTTRRDEMAIGDSKEDLSAYSREDLVYKAKLAEQAERCARRTNDAIDWNDLARGFRSSLLRPRLDGWICRSFTAAWMTTTTAACERPRRSFDGWSANGDGDESDDESDDDRTSDEWIFDESRTRLDLIYICARMTF